MRIIIFMIWDLFQNQNYLEKDHYFYYLSFSNLYLIKKNLILISVLKFEIYKNF
jgi:hypothetical protein